MNNYDLSQEEIEQGLYRQMVYESPHNISLIRRLQEDLRNKNFDIPIVFCGYRNELGCIETHPNTNENQKGLNIFNGK